MPTEITEQQARDELWERGVLSWKLRPAQLKIRLTSANRKSRKVVEHCSRRLGKSYGLCISATEYAMSALGSRWPVRYTAPTRTGLRQVIHPIMRHIFEDCPPHLKPKWNRYDNQYQFPGGGIIHLAGVNNGHEDDARGTAAGLAIVDEAGFVDKLSYLVDDVLMPQTINTGGYVILSSSSPKTPAHDFVGYIEEAQAAGSYSLYTIHDSDYPTEIIEEFKKEAGGELSTTWRREYLCELVVDENSAIVPEWNEKFSLPWPRDTDYFQFYHLYEAMDVGGRDKTAILFGYRDFKAAKTIIEDEFVIDGPRMTTELIAKVVKEKEKMLWGGRSVYRRIADNNNIILLNDLSTMHGLRFMPTNKDELEAMVNEVRIAAAAGKLIVHPRCTQTLGCLKYGIWNKKRTEFERSKTFGHFDALAALIYLIRNLDENTNPIPADFRVATSTHFIPPKLAEPAAAATWKQIMGVNKRGINGRH